MNALSPQLLRNQISQIQGLKIIVIGDFILDHFIFGSVHRQSPEAPVPVLDLESEIYMPGGAGNVAINLKKLGCDPVPFGVRGEDEAGSMLVKYLDESGIPTLGLHVDRSRPTTTKTRLIELPHQHRIRYDREVRTSLDDELRDALIRSILDLLPEASGVLISDYAKGVVDQELLNQVQRACQNQNIPCVVDPKPQHKQFYRNARVLTPNTKEAAALSGMPCDSDDEVERSGKALISELHLEGLLITRSEKGMSLFPSPQAPVLHVRTHARKVIDVSGAGDTVIAVFTAALASGASWETAASLANLASGIAVSKLGTSFVTPDELYQALAI